MESEQGQDNFLKERWKRGVLSNLAVLSAKASLLNEGDLEGLISADFQRAYDKSTS